MFKLPRNPFRDWNHSSPADRQIRLWFKLPRNPFRDWNNKELHAQGFKVRSNCLETLSGIETQGDTGKSLLEDCSNCLETLSGIETSRRLEGRGQTIVQIASKPFQGLKQTRRKGRTRFCLVVQVQIASKPFQGLKQCSRRSSIDLRWGSNCLETLSGIETVWRFWTGVSTSSVQIASKPFQGLKPLR